MLEGDCDDILTSEDMPADASRDFLSGGPGNDLLLAQSSDVVTGEGGDDNVVIQAEPAQNNITVADFQVGLDKLFIMWKDLDKLDIEMKEGIENIK